MKLQLCLFLSLTTSVSISCQIQFSSSLNQKITKVAEIPLPEGFERVSVKKNSFEFYLRNLRLKSDNTVYLYDGSKKLNQSLHYAVIDIPLSNKNLQQCADAIMRLRATYFFDKNEYDKIIFKSKTKTYAFQSYKNLAQLNSSFENYLEIVFLNCGTYNLDEMLNKKSNLLNISIGDVFIKAGSPGHAMIVVDVAVNTKNKKVIYLLAQSFMPAQSMHIVINPNNTNYSPWYKADENNLIKTPGYTFKVTELKTW